MGYARVGSNPADVVLFLFYFFTTYYISNKNCIFCFSKYIYKTNGGLAQSVERVVRNDEAPGSKPGFSITYDDIKSNNKYMWANGLVV